VHLIELVFVHGTIWLCIELEKNIDLFCDFWNACKRRILEKTVNIFFECLTCRASEVVYLPIIIIIVILHLDAFLYAAYEQFQLNARYNLFILSMSRICVFGDVSAGVT